MSSLRAKGIRFIAVALVLVMILVAFLPRLISSQVIYGPLLDRLREENFHLDVGEVRLRWFSPITLSDIAIREQGTDAASLLQIEEIRTERGLLGYLFSHIHLGKVTVVKPVVDVQLLQNESNLQRLVKAMAGSKKSDKDSPPPKIDIDIVIDGASVIVRKSEMPEPLVVVPPLRTQLAYRSVDREPHVTIDPTLWLDHVQLTPELMSLGLELALPTLAKSAWFDGELSLSSDRVEIPLDHLERAMGKSTITFHQVRAGLQKPEMIAVVNMLGKVTGRTLTGEVYLMDGSQVSVEVADGFVAHDNLQFGLPRVDPRLQISTRGRVGIEDRTLAGQITFPVPLQWLARSDDVKEMGVPTVTLPLSGTLDEPKVQWMAMRQESADLLRQIQGKLGEEAKTSAAVVGALEGLAGGSGDDAIRATAELLGQLRDLRRKRQDAKSQDNAEQTEPTESLSEPTADSESPPSEPRLRLRDRLRRRPSNNPDL